jgi:hypothetical protein
MKEKLFFILRLSAGIGIIIALFKFVPYQEFITNLKYSRKIYIFWGFIVNSLTFILGCLRWKLLLSGQRIKIPVGKVFASTFASNFFNLFFPSFIAGDVFRGMANRRYGDTKKILSTVFMDRFSGMVALAIISLIALTIGFHVVPNQEVFSAVFLLVMVILIIFFIMFNRTPYMFLLKLLQHDSPLKNKLITFHEQLIFFRENPRIFWESVGVSLVIQFFSIIAFYLTAKAFNITVGFLYFLILVPIIAVISTIPITIAGAGTREAAAIYFFSLAGIAKSISLSISLFSLIFTVFLGIAGGIFYVTIYHRQLQCDSSGNGTEKLKNATHRFS